MPSNRRLAGWAIPLVAVLLAIAALVVVSQVAGHRTLPAGSAAGSSGESPSAGTAQAAIVAALLGGWVAAFAVAIGLGRRRRRTTSSPRTGAE